MRTVSILAALLLLSAAAKAGPATQAQDAQTNATLAQRLIEAYPGSFKGLDGNDLIWSDGTRMPFDDGERDKPFETLLNRPSIRDQFLMPYTKGPVTGAPPENFDPGRVRYEPLFAKMYGDCSKGEVSAKLTSIDWLPKHHGGHIKISSVNKLAQALQDVSKELDELPESFMKYLIPTSGTYNCREIAGTSRRSMHAYGAAIDINAKYSHYWRWSEAKDGKAAYKNTIPYEIAAIFEKHGFIWGAKWYHFDTMHFEYRPELLAPPAEASQ
jgi:hypothetical protein